jgi:hypothetical protein
MFGVCSAKQAARARATRYEVANMLKTMLWAM